MKDGVRKYCNKCHRKSWPRTKAQESKSNSKWKTGNYDKFLLHQVRSTAKRKGLDFDLEVDDLAVPARCPVLGIPLFRTPGKRTANTPSVDRLNNLRGYVKGNVAVVSWRANQIKRDASLEELRALVDFLEWKTGG